MIQMYLSYYRHSSLWYCYNNYFYYNNDTLTISIAITITITSIIIIITDIFTIFITMIISISTSSTLLLPPPLPINNFASAAWQTSLQPVGLAQAMEAHTQKCLETAVDPPTVYIWASSQQGSEADTTQQSVKQGTRCS